MSPAAPAAPAALTAGRWRGLMLPEYRDAGLPRLFEDAFPAPGFSAERIHGNIGATWRLSSPGLPTTLFAKHFVHPPLVALTSLFRETGATRSWRAATIMAKEKITGPRPVAVMTRKTAGLTVESVFISEAIPNPLDRDLERYFRGRFDRPDLGPDQLREKREIIDRLADLFRAAHGQDRIYFPDFHPHNMVATREDGQLKLWLVDFDEVIFSVRPNDRLKNLASLGRNSIKVQKKMTGGRITTGDRLRFLLRYAGPDATRSEVHRLWREVLDHWELR
jgi:hypothetical protein